MVIIALKGGAIMDMKQVICVFSDLEKLRKREDLVGFLNYFHNMSDDAINAMCKFSVDTYDAFSAERERRELEKEESEREKKMKEGMQD